MNPHISFSNTSDKLANSKEFTQMIDAILDGKYSWACVLLLRHVGENPLNYIPYRTYNRLIKVNAPINKLSRQETRNISSFNEYFTEDSTTQCLPKRSQITSLNYFGKDGKQYSAIHRKKPN